MGCLFDFIVCFRFVVLVLHNYIHPFDLFGILVQLNFPDLSVEVDSWLLGFHFVAVYLLESPHPVLVVL